MVFCGGHLDESVDEAVGIEMDADTTSLERNGGKHSRDLLVRKQDTVQQLGSITA